MKNYSDINVYDAANARIDFIFKNFERVFLSFSGGKDSGVMLNLCIDYIRKHGIKEKMGIQILDNEANYSYSSKFMHSILEKNLDILDVYWCCLPITLPCTVSAYHTEWQCWGVKDEKRWITPMPTQSYIVNMQNHKFDFFKENMSYDEFWDEFGEWYAQGKKTAKLVGIRADESLNRFRAIMNKEKVMIDGLCWTKQNSENVFNCYPIYDWKTQDIWVGNGKFEWEYNELYNVFYMAGLTIAQMRVASPFMSESKSSLNLYRVIDPHIWSTLCARVHGANFVATYGRQLNYNKFKLPPGHTWKSFVKFLLGTLPKEVAENFKMRFIQSIRYWARVGQGQTEEIIQQLKDKNVPFGVKDADEEGAYMRFGRKNKRLVTFWKYPDHLDMLSCHNGQLASWKRFAMTILKNDHVCKYMGFAPTKEQALRQREIMEKYKNI